MDDFITLIAEVMGVDSRTLSLDTAYGEEPWDSLMHMRLVMEVEEEYDVEIPIDEVPDIKTIKDLYRYTQA